MVCDAHALSKTRSEPDAKICQPGQGGQQMGEMSENHEVLLIKLVRIANAWQRALPLPSQAEVSNWGQHHVPSVSCERCRVS